jgi:putative transposase
MVIPHEEYLALGEENEERRRAYVALFDHEVSGRELTAIREGTEKGEAIGSEHFQEEMARRLQRQVTRLGYGGDRKSKAFRGVE